MRRLLAFFGLGGGGNLSADTRVEILPTGALTGTVKSASFTAADGASVKGEIWVEPPARVPEARA